MSEASYLLRWLAVTTGSWKPAPLPRVTAASTPNIPFWNYKEQDSGDRKHVRTCARVSVCVFVFLCVRVCDADISEVSIEPLSVVHALLDNNNLSVMRPSNQIRANRTKRKQCPRLSLAALG